MTDEENGELFQGKLTLSMMLRLILVAFVLGAVIGQIIDISYPIFGALDYHYPTIEIPALGIEIYWVITVLYGVAGVILWVGYILLLRWTKEIPRGGFNPKWGFMLAGIACFIVQFWLGPFLSGSGVNNIWIFVFMISTAFLVWWAFDRTKAGLIMLFVAGSCGPLAEFTMINVLNLYHYTRPDIFGLPLWFIGAYMMGAAPNGMVARKYLIHLQKTKSKDLTKEKTF